MQTRLVRAGDLPSSFEMLSRDEHGTSKRSAYAERTGFGVRVSWLGHRVILAPSQRVRVCL
jgi:hypothetical protein